MSERRIRNNRLRRQRQLRRHILIGTVTMVLTVILSSTFGGFLLKANAKKDEETYFKYYTSIEVKYGDTLWSIATEHMTPQYESVEDYVYEVMEMNHLKEDTIHAGEYIIIPYYSAEFVS